MCFRILLTFQSTILLCAFACIVTHPAAFSGEVSPQVASSEASDRPAEPNGSPAVALKSCEVETQNFADVAKRVRCEVGAHGAENVLVVVDIDNTTLAMDQSLGSDQWFNWQYNFIFKDIESPLRVARNLDELLRIQGLLFALGKMHPPEPTIPTVISEIQKLGCCTIVLTSRGPEFRDATERELKRNGYDFSDSALSIVEPIRGSFLPYNKAKPDAHGLSAQELETLRDPRPVSYANGVMMSAGQHKGYMLQTLLARSNRKFRAIVFADDHSKHTSRMTDAFKGSGTTTASFHYVREQPNVNAFEESDKQQAIEDWTKLNKVLHQVFLDPRGK